MTARVALAVAALLLAAGRPARAQTPEPTEIDPASVTLYPDQGRLEIEGTSLKNLRIRWESAHGPGLDVCADPKPSTGNRQRCALSVPRDLGGDARLSWGGPASSTGAADLATSRPPAGFLPLRVARVVIDRVFPAATSAVDLTNGVGRVPLVHPEAVASVDCAQARCELDASSVQVRAISAAASTLTMHTHLAPHYFILRGDTTDNTFSQALAVLHCPAAIVSGDPIRRADATSVLVRMDGRCGGQARDLRWTANGDPAQVERVAKEGDAVLVLVSVGDLEDATLTLTASRPEPDGSVIAVARAPTRAAPLPRATLELPGHGQIDFLPTNRDALVQVAPVGAHAHLVPLASEGAYRVTTDAAGAHVRGEESGGGFVGLRFGYRVEDVPAAFAETNFAVITESLQRPIREASIPAPIGASALGPNPLVELDCTDVRGKTERIVPGRRTSIAFAARDGCRVVIHREWFKPEDGTQDLTVDVDVTKVDDTPRSDSHVSERMVLRPGPESRVFWIRGVKAQFDRVTIRVAHVADDARYVGASDAKTSFPSVQWTLVVGEGHLRFYATAAIPTGLFHITAPSGVLTLNFGALSRLTWLDQEGHEGLVGLELGAMGIGLAPTVTFPSPPPALAVLAGIGVSIPIGNRGEPTQAAVNLHAWLAYELRSEYTYVSGSSTITASHWSFLFGPSITIGNIGTNL